MDGGLDNPYPGARWYVNPLWSAKAAAEPGGSKVANQPTAVWLDSVASVTAPAGSGVVMGMRDHLDAALAQGASLIQFVLKDLPGRDCIRLTSNGEFTPGQVAQYESQFIDPIAAIEADPAYSAIRIVNVIEPYALPSMIVGEGTSTPECQEVLASGDYLAGIRYALGKLHTAGPNVYNYLDAAHHGWIGWSTNFQPAAQLLASVVAAAPGGFATVQGIATNTADYGATTEPYFTIATMVVGASVRQSKWVDWNGFVDELSFAQAFRTQLITDGFPSTIGMIIDTSRNGWGGAARPAGPSTSTEVNQFVDESRIDRRDSIGNWCNQIGAGLGARPQASPASGIDAFTWLKPPGESDGAALTVGLDSISGEPMCQPDYAGNSFNSYRPSDAMPGAPVAGAWFSQEFQDLMANAYPPL